jgi:hypothetical protein
VVLVWLLPHLSPLTMPNIFKNTRLEWLTRISTEPRAAAPTTVASPSSDEVAAPVSSRSTDPLLFVAWFGSGIATILIPLFSRTIRMKQYQYQYYQYSDEEDEQQAGDNNTYDVNNCKWWQFACSSYYMNDGNGEAQEDEAYTPDWFSGWGQSQEQREYAKENGQTTGALRFVYAWQIIMFAAILFYGTGALTKRRSPTGILGMLLIWANFNFLSMWMLADGSIEMMGDGRAVETSGFYGHFAVLMFMTNAWYTLFGVVFSVVFVLQSRLEHKAACHPQNKSSYPSTRRSLLLRTTRPIRRVLLLLRRNKPRKTKYVRTMSRLSKYSVRISVPLFLA